MAHGKIFIVFKTKSNKKHPYSAGGLAANALHTVAVLREMGFDTHLMPVEDLADLHNQLAGHRPACLVIEAVWITAQEAADLAAQYPDTQVVVRAHSKMGFLQVEPEAIAIMRGVIDQSQYVWNLHFSSNNDEFATSIREAFGSCLYLPNLYDVTSSPRRSHHHEPAIRIASFGASRLLKLHSSAGLAALQIARRLGRPLEFFVNVDKTPGGQSVRKSVEALLGNLPDVRLIELPWQPAHEFRETIAQMDLVIQLSATETFCMVAADAVASGVPVVAGPAISWLPEKCIADIDRTNVVADVAICLLSSARLQRQQREALDEYLRDARCVWERFLTKKHR